MIPTPKVTAAPEIERKGILDWNNGVVSDFNARRIVDNALSHSENMILEQNGVLRPRPALSEYGPQPIGIILGELYECKVMNGATPTFYLICVMNVNGTANAYYTTGESETWTKITGKNYNNSARCHFVMVAGKVLVTNGVDVLSYIDPKTWTITAYEALADPTTAPTATAHNLTGTNYQVYYAVSANSTVGETACSPVKTVQVGKDRSTWNTENEEYVEISWTPVANAKSYNVYMGITSDGAGTVNLYSIADGIDAAKTNFTDNGTRAQNALRIKNTYNSTAGPKATRGTVVNGRVFLVGDPDNPYNVWIGGDFGYELDFSAANGGGYTTVANGTKEIPVSVKPFRKGTGDNTVVVLTQGSNGSGKRYHLSPNTISYANTTFTAWASSEDGGSEGTDSPDGVVFFNNSLYYPSRSGFRTTGTMPQLQNVLSTTDISATIRDQVDLLNTSSLDKAVGAVWNDKIYWSVPVGSDKNNRVWVFDTAANKGSWYTSWYINVDWFTLYNDNEGSTHFLMVSDNRILETSRTAKTTDGDKPFNTRVDSGQIQWKKDGREWARLIQVVFTFLKPTGDFDIQVKAHTEDGDTTYTQSVSIPKNNIAKGWGEARHGWATPVAWNDVDHSELDDEYETIEYQDVMIEVDEDVQWFSYNIYSTKPGVDYALHSIVAEYVSIGIKDLS